MEEYNVTNVSYFHDGNDSHVGNGSSGGSGSDFFHHYFSPERFSTECVLALVSVVVNATACHMANMTHHQQYAYYALFRNLTLANALNSLFSWVSNNSLFLLRPWMASWEGDICQLSLIMLLANLLVTALALVGATSLLGFSIVHFVAVGHPLIYSTAFSRRSVLISLAMQWVGIVLLCLLPIASYVYVHGISGKCTFEQLTFLNLLIVWSSNASLIILGLVYVSIMTLCVAIYYQIWSLQVRISQYLWVDEMQVERRTFWSIVRLFLTMTAFYIPFFIVYAISHNSDSGDLYSSAGVVYYMTLLPYFKLITDPLLYRRTFVDIKKDITSIFHNCHPCVIFPRCICIIHRDRRFSGVPATTRTTRMSSKRPLPVQVQVPHQHVQKMITAL